MKIIFFFFLLFIISCNDNKYEEGEFSNSEKIVVYSSSASSLQWETSIRDYEVIVIVSDQVIKVINNSVDNSTFTTANTRYWRLSFNTGVNGNINPSTDMSSSITSYKAAELNINTPKYWIVYSFDMNGNLIRSSSVYTFN